MTEMLDLLPVTALVLAVFLIPMAQQNVHGQNQTLSCTNVSSCYDQGYAQGQAHPGTSCTEAQKEIQTDNYINYCAGISDGSANSQAPTTNPLSPNNSQTGMDWIDICNKVQSVLVPPCSQLVNPDNTLTPAGETAVGCIRNGLILGLGAISQGIPEPIVIAGLKALATPTGCGGIVNMDQIQSVTQMHMFASLLGQ